MYFEQFYLTCLAHASYMVASEGIAAVVDPQRDVQIYLEEARKNAFRIEHIIETHLHADFVSGHRELASLTGAKIYIGEKAGARFPHVPVRDGDSVCFGRCRLQFLQTPGHTTESISILVTDLDRSPQPFAVLTGDTLFIGDVGRPDLSPEHTPQQLAALLYDSLHAEEEMPAFMDWQVDIVEQRKLPKILVEIEEKKSIERQPAIKLGPRDRLPFNFGKLHGSILGRELPAASTPAHRW